jgi:hypothetical protein
MHRRQFSTCPTRYKLDARQQVGQKTHKRNRYSHNEQHQNVYTPPPDVPAQSFEPPFSVVHYINVSTKKPPAEKKKFLYRGPLLSARRAAALMCAQIGA